MARASKATWERDAKPATKNEMKKKHTHRNKWLFELIESIRNEEMKMSVFFDWKFDQVCIFSCTNFKHVHRCNSLFYMHFLALYLILFCSLCCTSVCHAITCNLCIAHTNQATQWIIWKVNLRKMNVHRDSSLFRLRSSFRIQKYSLNVLLAVAIVSDHNQMRNVFCIYQTIFSWLMALLLKQKERKQLISRMNSNNATKWLKVNLI